MCTTDSRSIARTPLAAPSLHNTNRAFDWRIIGASCSLAAKRRTKTMQILSISQKCLRFVGLGRQHDIPVAGKRVSRTLVRSIIIGGQSTLAIIFAIILMETWPLRDCVPAALGAVDCDQIVHLRGVDSESGTNGRTNRSSPKCD